MNQVSDHSFKAGEELAAMFRPWLVQNLGMEKLRTPADIAAAVAAAVAASITSTLDEDINDRVATMVAIGDALLVCAITELREFLDDNGMKEGDSIDAKKLANAMGVASKIKPDLLLDMFKIILYLRPSAGEKLKEKVDDVARKIAAIMGNDDGTVN